MCFLKIHTVKLCIICQAVLSLGSFCKAVLFVISDFLHGSTLIRQARVGDKAVAAFHIDELVFALSTIIPYKNLLYNERYYCR